jgi:cytochrome c-type biogenesis protein CcmH/NrfG
MSMNETEFAASRGWKSAQVYTMAALCLVIGVVLGYLFRGSASKPLAATPVTQVSAGPTLMNQPSMNRASGSPAGTAPQIPSLDQMKHMADKQAEPLLDRLKVEPNNSELLSQIATIYEKTHQFKQAVDYFQKAVQRDPKNMAARTELASCLYYEGDVDGALQQLQQTLTQNPADANSLFNLGMIRWKGKSDAKGAIDAWNQLLKSNPGMSSDRKAQMQKLISEVRQQAVN